MKTWAPGLLRMLTHSGTVSMACLLSGLLFSHVPEGVESDYKLVAGEKVQPAGVCYLACKVTL